MITHIYVCLFINNPNLDFVRIIFFIIFVSMRTCKNIITIVLSLIIFLFKELG